jgi:glutamate formiminotransferase / 5-formyltetrahydrofolate cyclo-ligase
MRPPGPLLECVPNVSEGRDASLIRRLATAAEGGGARLVDVHADVDHHRSVFTLAAAPGGLAAALAAGTEEALRRIDLSRERGIHPHVGVVDVVPVVHRTAADRGAACAEALVAGEEIGRLGVPVLLYGSLAGGRTRAEIRRGGPAALAERLSSGELTPDFGPPRMDPRRGATMVAARPPLIAFNLEVDAPLDVAVAAARAVREGGADALPGVRALGLELETGGIVQVSVNVEDHEAVPLAMLLEAVRRHATVVAGEVVGLPPRAAFEGWPDDVPVRNRRTLEEALGE